MDHGERQHGFVRGYTYYGGGDRGWNEKIDVSRQTSGVNNNTIMSFKFEKLKVWNVALELTDEVDAIARSFPKHELFTLASQIKRAADSVVLNIAEGSTLQTDNE